MENFDNKNLQTQNDNATKVTCKPAKNIAEKTQAQIPKNLQPTKNLSASATNDPQAKNNASDCQTQSQNAEHSKLQNETAVQMSMFDETKENSLKPTSLHTEQEFKIRKVKELAVFTQSKATLNYIFTCTKNAPKIYRWSIVEKLQTTATKLVELLYTANLYENTQRLDFQKSADAHIKLLSAFAEMSLENKVITKSQYATLTKHIYYTRKLLWGWMKCKE